MREIEKKLAELLNRGCAENESDTPDYILAEYLLDCLEAFDKATNLRTAWYKKKAKARLAKRRWGDEPSSKEMVRITHHRK